MVMIPRDPEMVVGYVDQPAGTPRGDTDAERLREAGVINIRHEENLDRRPVWREMIAVCDGVDVVVIVALDRLGRPIQSLLRSVVGLRHRGISLRCLDGNVDVCSATSLGQAQTCIVAALVACLDTWETERARHRDKTMAERGSRPGARPKLKTASSDDLLAMLGRPGANHTSVARELGVGRTTLYRHLKRTSASG